MPRMRIASTTGYMDDVLGLRRLPAGTVLEVDDETAKRWRRHDIAAPTDLPLGVVSDAEASMSAADLDAEIARLEALKARGPAARPAAALPAAEEEAHPLARYGLGEAQRTALWRAGFTSTARVDAATDAELLEVPGVGESTLAKLRAGG